MRDSFDCSAPGTFSTKTRDSNFPYPYIGADGFKLPQSDLQVFAGCLQFLKTVFGLIQTRFGFPARPCLLSVAPPAIAGPAAWGARQGARRRR